MIALSLGVPDPFGSRARLHSHQSQLQFRDQKRVYQHFLCDICNFTIRNCVRNSVVCLFGGESTSIGKSLR